MPLGLLLARLSPEQVQVHLEGRLVQQGAPTGLSDPIRNPSKEVGTVAQPRGPVEIKGVTTRTTEQNRSCEACPFDILAGTHYERVARTEGAIESYHTDCFEDEFGSRGLYGV